MFTGIVRELGILKSREKLDGDVRLEVEVPATFGEQVHIGDSIAINGVCLTVVERDEEKLGFDISSETLSKSRFGDMETGCQVNLEPALSASDRLGGHFVTGHVDGIGEVTKIEPDARSHRIEIEAPDAVARYIAEKGSITVDGVSLTVNHVDGSLFGVNIVPHTWTATNMQGYAVGTRVHIEVDIIARYLERLMGDRDTPSASEDITADFLSKQGFAPPLLDDEEDGDLKDEQHPDSKTE